MTQTQPWTVGKLLEWTTEYLRKNGSDTARLDAEVLLAHARQCQRIQLYTSFDQEPSEQERAAFREMVRRRAEGTPVAYLVGYKEFYSLNFVVSPDVLIPRPETEHVVIEALDCAKRKSGSIESASSPPSSLRIADLCTGSGCIAIALAKHLPGSKIIAGDISAKATYVASGNAERHQVQDRVQVVESDLFENLGSNLFDLVVSNPPYITEEEYVVLPRSVKEHEPKVALVAADHGMAVIDRLLREAPSHLVEGGWLIFEISPMLSPTVMQRLASSPQWRLERIAKDLAGHARVVVVRKSSVE